MNAFIFKDLQNGLLAAKGGSSVGIAGWRLVHPVNRARPMKAEIDPREAAAAHSSARAHSRFDARARDLTLSKIRSPCA